jgi:hypothetical protein
MTEAGPNLTAWLSQRPRPLLGGIALAMFVLVAVIRYETSPRLDVTLFFLIPVSFALWFVSRTLGWFFVAIAVAIMLHFDHLHWGRAWDTVEFWNAMMSGATLAVFAVIFSEVRGLYQRAQAQSLQDSLTGLANRRAFLSLLAAENRRLRREGKPLTLGDTPSAMPCYAVLPAACRALCAPATLWAAWAEMNSPSCCRTLLKLRQKPSWGNYRSGCCNAACFRIIRLHSALAP